MNAPLSYTRLVVVIPTRNRAALAIRAIRSVLDYPNDDLKVLVSDNSTDIEDHSALQGFCAELEDNRLDYIRPPRPLPMSEHWDWAIQQGLNSYDASHYAYVTDRAIFKRGGLQDAVHIAARCPEALISYGDDKVIDWAKPIRVAQLPWSGKIVEVQTANMLYLASEGDIWHAAFPRMLNCVVPRMVLDSMNRRFGNVFSSIAPDYSFCFRFLEMFDWFAYYDKATYVQYAFERSSGTSAARGVKSRDYIDFVSSCSSGDNPPWFAAPIPEIGIPVNAIFHEYYVCKRETGSAKFPSVKMSKYLQILAQAAQNIENLEVRSDVMARLRARGWVGAPDSFYDNVAAIARRAFSPSRVLARFLRGLCRPWTKAGWLFLARRCGVCPPDGGRFEFSTVEEALEYAMRYPRMKSPMAHLDSLLLGTGEERIESWRESGRASVGKPSRPGG